MCQFLINKTVEIKLIKMGTFVNKTLVQIIKVMQLFITLTNVLHVTF